MHTIDKDKQFITKEDEIHTKQAPYFRRYRLQTEPGTLQNTKYESLGTRQPILFELKSDNIASSGQAINMHTANTYPIGRRRSPLFHKSKINCRVEKPTCPLLTGKALKLKYRRAISGRFWLKYSLLRPSKRLPIKIIAPYPN
ncbi:hypothetical protein AVEN_81345-1 [Araneus ventricosus]|uniref:Uncharacterized protein n=1 Tax=Araneus ventricosus TaxID=182803 RepID=A0A4Y2B9I4_ARAVE|nr:hypothetical protein AVEN_81345-1 [Araneus ventricosus]